MKLKIMDDKLLHFSFSCILVIVFNLFFNSLLSISLVWGIGILKEIWDEKYGSGFSEGDIIANGFGIIFAGIIIGAKLLLK